MAAATSPGTGRTYGVERVGRAWGVARASFYAWRRQARSEPRPAVPSSRRGPKPAIPGTALLAAIRADLARSPWTGEGHRKVWARLRVLDGLRVARQRGLRLMREHALLSPHRCRPRPAGVPDRRSATAAPNLMGGTDATQIATGEDGRVWLVAGIEPWNAEALGWPVTQRGDRLAAVQAAGLAVKRAFGALGAGAARGVAGRHDHGGAFMADHFQNQIRFWGMAPSDAFIAEPETNGVAERFFRTLKAQIVHGRVYRTIDEVRAAVRLCVEGYNAAWLIEKNGLLSPLDARAAWQRKLMPAAA